MPLTTRFLALLGESPVSALFRLILRELLVAFQPQLPGLDIADRMAVYEARDRIFLATLASRNLLYAVISSTLKRHLESLEIDHSAALQILQLDRALCPRSGGEHTLQRQFNFDAAAAHRDLSSMKLPEINTQVQNLQIRHPGGLGDILLVADGGCWLQGVVEAAPETASEIQWVAIA